MPNIIKKQKKISNKLYIELYERKGLMEGSKKISKQVELYERKGLMVGSLERNLSSTKLTENED